MRKVFVVLILIMVALPALVGIIDAMWWFYTNHTLTSLDWVENRFLLANASLAISIPLWVLFFISE